MFPCFSLEDMSDAGLGDFVDFGDGSLTLAGIMKGKDFRDVFLGEFCVVVVGSSGGGFWRADEWRSGFGLGNPSALGFGVGKVVSGGSEEEVFGVAASGVIAGVADEEVGEELSVVDCEGNSACWCFLSSEVHSSVGAWLSSPAFPFPAVVWESLFYFSEESVMAGMVGCSCPLESRGRPVRRL